VRRTTFASGQAGGRQRSRPLAFWAMSDSVERAVEITGLELHPDLSPNKRYDGRAKPEPAPGNEKTVRHRLVDLTTSSDKNLATGRAGWDGVASD